jgi:ligand-binding SRPBCC domain-containing protein
LISATGAVFLVEIPTFASATKKPAHSSFRWIARITEFERHRYSADVQDSGPFKNWHHRHEFAAEAKTQRQVSLPKLFS